MKSSVFLALLIAGIFYYLRCTAHTAPVPKVVAQPVEQRVSRTIVVAAAPSYRDRWKTGPNAQTDLSTCPTAQTNLKTGPNAQTDFEPFAPSQHATWNQTPGYSIVSGAKLRVK